MWLTILMVTYCRPWLKGFATCTAKRREWKTITGELLLYNDMTIIYLFTYVSYKESFCKSSKLCYFQPLLNIKRSSATPGERHSDPTIKQSFNLKMISFQTFLLCLEALEQEDLGRLTALNLRCRILLKKNLLWIGRDTFKWLICRTPHCKSKRMRHRPKRTSNSTQVPPEVQSFFLEVFSCCCVMETLLTLFFFLEL